MVEAIKNAVNIRKRHRIYVKKVISGIEEEEEKDIEEEIDFTTDFREKNKEMIHKIKIVKEKRAQLKWLQLKILDPVKVIKKQNSPSHR